MGAAESPPGLGIILRPGRARRPVNRGGAAAAASAPASVPAEGPDTVTAAA
jgi:hypothetical protein